MDVVKSQTLLVNSDNCSNPAQDRPWDFGVALEPDLVRCRPGQKLRLELKRLCARAMWQWIPAGGQFELAILTGKGITGVTVPISAGNPTFVHLAHDITDAAGIPGFQCKFLAAQQKLTFHYPGAQAVAVDFTGSKRLQSLLGFGPGGVITAVGDTLTSEFPMNDTPFDSVELHVRGVNAETGCQNGMNMTPGMPLQSTNVLAAFQVNSEPFGLMEYRNVDRTFATVLTDDTVRHLRFWLTDWNDNPLLQLTQFYMYLQVDTIRPTMTFAF